MSAQSQSHTVQQLQTQLKNVLAANHGTVKLSDLPAAWLAVHRTPLHYATYGARSIVDLLDKCRIVCRLERVRGFELVRLIYNQSAVANFVTTIRQDLHRSRRHVAYGVVLAKACQQLGVNDYKELGLGNPYQLPALNRLSELETRIVTYITSYIATRTIATIYDLQLTICSLENVESFDDLTLGPVQEIPLVKRCFNLPAGQAEVLQVTTKEVLDALSFLMRRGRRDTDDRIAPKDIVLHVAETRHVDPMALGIRVTAIGYYIKMTSDIRRNERQANEALMEQSKQLEAHAAEKAATTRASLEAAYAADLATLQKKQSEQLQAVQQRLQERLANIFNESLHKQGSQPRPNTLEQGHILEVRKTGVVVKHADAFAHRQLSWTQLAEFVTELGQQPSLSTFAEAVVTHFLSGPATVAATQQDVQPAASHKRAMSFWQTDLLAGLLMQAIMVINGSTLSSDSMLLSVLGIGSCISLDTASLTATIFAVPGVMLTSLPNMQWLTLYWNLLTLAIGVVSSDRPHSDSTAELANKLCAAFAENGTAAAVKKSNKKISKFWLEDGLAHVLLEALQSHVRSGHAQVDALTIQQYLIQQSRMEYSQPATDSQLTAKYPSLADTISPVNAVDTATLTAAVSRLQDGSSVTSLARLEQQLLHQFQVSSFAQLGQGSSMLQWLAGNTGGSDANSLLLDQALVPLHEVMHVMHQAIRELASSTHDEAIHDPLCQALCHHFSVNTVEQLGHGSVAKLKGLYQSYNQTSSCAVGSLAALTCTQRTTSHQASSMSRERAIQLLQGAPYLTDLEEWLQWSVTAQGSLGPLHAFLQAQGCAADIAVLALHGGQLVKVEAAATPSTFLSAASAGESTAAMAAVLGMVASQGLNSTSLALLASHAEAALETLASGNHWRADSADNQEPAATFILECLRQLPQQIRPVLAKQVLMQPFAKVVGSQARAETAVVNACNSSTTAHMLYSLGMQLGVTSWQQERLQSAGTTSMQATKTPQQEPPLVTSTAQGQQSSTTHKGGVVDFNELLSNPASPDAPDTRTPAAEHTAAVDAGGKQPTVAVGMTEQDLKSSSEAADSSVCQQMVEDICRIEFGMGVELDSVGTELRQKQNDRLGRALHRLSEDLYSKDVHFVLELVQNADDNVYAVGAAPALEFLLAEDGISVLNNEVGFSKENVHALCDVGNSTKQHKVGYIGQKGIGFKSVFKVTDAAEIHSNGFHISFDLTKHESLGYVLPTWVQPRAHAEPRIASFGAAATQVYLPYKQTLHQKVAQLLHNFDDIQPTLLLFLQRLQCIAITDLTANGKSAVMLRRQVSNDVVELRYGSDAQHIQQWLVVTQTVQPGVKRLDVDLKETELALAFELDTKQIHQQQVFAFLPLRSYGLRFIVQANFLVPASREAVEKDSAWNQELLSHLPILFLQALESFRRLPGADQLVWVNRWLQCAPLPGEAEDFFAPLPQAIISCLRGAPCIATENSTWVLPAEAVISVEGTAAARGLLAQAISLGIPSVNYVHPGLTALHSSSALRSALGIKLLDTDHLLHLLQTASAQGMFARLGAQWVANMLACIFDMLADKDPHIRSIRAQDITLSSAAQALLQQLKLLPMLPTSMDQWVAAGTDKDAALFMLPSTSKVPSTSKDPSGSAAEQKTPPHDSLHSALAACDLQLETMGLHMLADDFMDVADATRASLQKMLQLLKLRDLNHLDVIDQYVMPAFQAPSACELPARQLVSLLAIIGHSGLLRRSASDGPVASPDGRRLLQQLQQHAVIVTTSGARRIDSISALHMPASLGCKVDMQQLIPEHAFVTVSDDYAQHSLLPAAQMRKLLLQLGAADCIAVPEQTMILLPADKGTSAWADAVLGDAEGGWTICDHSGAEFEAVVQSIMSEGGSHTLDSLSNLVQIMSARWEAHYRHCLTAICTRQAGRKVNVHSSFAKALHTLPWLPSSQGTALKGGDLFLRTSREMTQVLDTHVPYLTAPVKSDSMLATLGVQTSLAVSTLLSLMHSWSQDPNFATSVQHMTHVYEYLSWQMASDTQAAAEVCTAFAQGTLIWLPNKEAIVSAEQEGPTLLTAALEFMPEPPKRGQVVAGQFYVAADKLFMRDHTHVIEDTDTSKMRVLLKYYSSNDLHTFFMQQLVYSHPGPSPTDQSASHYNSPWTQASSSSQLTPLVPMYPYTADYTQLLVDLALQPEPSEHIYTQATAVLLHWSRLIADAQMPLPDVTYLQQALNKQAVLPTTKGKWVSVADGLVIRDDEELGKAFDNLPVHFVWLPKSSRDATLDQLLPLLQAVGVPLLSQCVQQEAVPTGSHFNTEVTHMISHAFPYIQRFFFWHRAGDYNHVAGAVLPMLDGFSCSETRELYVVYNLTLQPGKPVITSSLKRNAAMETSDDGKRSMLHVVEGDAGNLHDAFLELHKFFGLLEIDTDLVEFLQALIVTQLAGQSVESFMERRGFHALPDHEEVWAVPVSEAPAAYNLRGHIIDAAEDQQEELNEAPSDLTAGDAVGPPKDKPARSRQKVEIWPPAAPLIPVAPPSSQAASLPSDAPRNTYLHDNLRPVAHVDPDASPTIDTASGASDDDQLQFAATSGLNHQENNRAAAASGMGPRLGTGAVFHDSHASAAHGVSETGHGTAAGMLAASHHASDQPASELHSCGSQADSIDASAWGRASSRYNKPNERSSGDDVRHATEQPEHDSTTAGGVQESAGNGQTAQLRQLADSAPVKTLDIGVPFTLPAQDPAAAADGIEELLLPDIVLQQMTLPLPFPRTSLQDKEMDLIVGRWGEELVYQYLLSHTERGNTSNGSAWQVNWVNKDYNTSLPYDLHLRGPGGCEQFVEVKSSVSAEKAFFEMSHQEVQAARQLADQYSLYRVCGVGNKKPSLLRIVNPVQKWADAIIKVCVVL